MNKDLMPHNKNGQPHGYWEVYRERDNTLQFITSFDNGIRVGYNEFRWSNGYVQKKYIIL